MRSSSPLLAVLTSATTISAHGWIDTLKINNQTYTGYNPTVAPWAPDQGTISWPSWNTDTGPVYSGAINSLDIICSINATNAKIAPAPVTAGSIIDLHWTKWPESHHGPIISYMAACNGDCAIVDKTKLRFFKIAEMGQLQLGAGGGTAGRWADDVLREANGAWNVTIPKSIKNGNYVLRNEIIALHSAYDVGAAQLYPTCISLAISGGGKATPQGVIGTQLYSKEDPSIHYNIYNDESKPVYKIPGPALCKWNFLRLWH
jgi:cellulase